VPAVEKVKDTPADAGIAKDRPIPKEKKLGGNYPPCPHCDNKQLVFHCNDKVQCTWLRCVKCSAIIEPSDWSHAHASHPTGQLRTKRRGCVRLQ
jgi:hypothetical protein